MDPVCFQGVDIPLHKRIVVHVSVHRRCEEDWTVNGNRKGRKSVISDAVCHLTDDVGCRRDDREEIRTVGEIDMRGFPVCAGVK